MAREQNARRSGLITAGYKKAQDVNQHTVTAHRPRIRRLLDRGDEAGSGGGISLVMLIFAIGLLMVLGLVIDGSAKARTLDHANQLATEAARAGLQAATPDGVDQQRVDAVVGAYLTAGGITEWNTRIVGGKQIVVDVTIQQNTKMLSMVGISTMTVHGEGTADVVYNR